MRRAFAIVFLAGVVALAVTALTKTSGLVYSPGVNPRSAATTLPPQARACQVGLRSPDGAEFDRVALTLGAPGAPVSVEVLDDTGRRLGGGRADAAAGERVVGVGAIRTDSALAVCVTNEGDAPVPVFGQAGVASPHSTGTINGKKTTVDFAYTLRTEPRSLLSLAPEIADRASLFRAGWISPAVYLVLALALLIGAPLLLARAVARAGACDAEPDARSDATTQVQART